MKKKTRVKAKTKPASAVSVSPDQDIVALLTTLAQKLTSFEAKLDTMLRRIAPQASVPAAPRPQPVLVSSPEARRDHRPLHKAVCADCHKECEVPFKPSGERPVYCKECFRTRRTNGTLKPQGGGNLSRPLQRLCR